MKTHLSKEHCVSDCFQSSDWDKLQSQTHLTQINKLYQHSIKKKEPLTCQEYRTLLDLSKTIHQETLNQEMNAFCAWEIKSCLSHPFQIESLNTKLKSKCIEICHDRLMDINSFGKDYEIGFLCDQLCEEVTEHKQNKETIILTKKNEMACLSFNLTMFPIRKTK